MNKDERTALKKPIIKKKSYKSYGHLFDTWLCPNCGEEYVLGLEELVFGAYVEDKPEQCPMCGQKLDWHD